MSDTDFINIRRLIASKNPRLLKWLPGFIIRYLERILHQEEINSFLINNAELKNQDFCQGVLDYFGVTYEVKGIEHIPAEGKCVLVMNHPLGGMDAMILSAAIRTRRTDIKFIVNDLLLNLEPLKDMFVGVNKHGKNSNSSRDQVSNLFASDKCVCVFPAGLVSRKINGKVHDLEWKKTFVKLGRSNSQHLVPIHISGQLSKWFYGLSRVRKFFGLKTNIEMLYLADEMFRQRGKHFCFTIGEAVNAADLDLSKSDKKWAEWFREEVYRLGEQ